MQAGGGPAGNDSYTCSANGSVDGGTCSTYTGNHEACSAGWAFQPGDTLFCSANNAGGDSGSTCSVYQPPTNGEYGNKCIAIAMLNGQQNGNATCSIIVTVGLPNSNGCSVVAAPSGGAPTNTTCTVFYGTGVTPTSGFQCSAFTPTGTATTGNCSVINSNGGLVSPPVGGLCGSGFGGHQN